MASNTRGRLKERFEGIHKNFDWVQEHCAKSLILIADKNPKLKSAIESLAKGVETLDQIAQDIYGRI